MSAATVWGTDGRTAQPVGGMNARDQRFGAPVSVRNARTSLRQPLEIRLGKRVPKITGGAVDRNTGRGTPGAHGRKRPRKAENLGDTGSYAAARIPAHLRPLPGSTF